MNRKVRQAGVIVKDLYDEIFVEPPGSQVYLFIPVGA